MGKRMAEGADSDTVSANVATAISHHAKQKGTPHRGIPSNCDTFPAVSDRGIRCYARAMLRMSFKSSVFGIFTSPSADSASR